MTEAEWLACDEPGVMVAFARSWASDRKLRLFGCACYRGLWATLSVPEVRRDVLRASERYADREITKQAFKLIRKRVSFWEGARVSGEAWEVAAASARDCSGESQTWVPDGEGYIMKTVRQRPEQARVHCYLFRDIFGNPFRHATFDPAWRSSTVVALAAQMYESRDFGAMPILADALQDAGCDSEDVLNHCRDAKATHVRGCWVVDLVLGKT